jgi:hypothetical protein
LLVCSVHRLTSCPCSSQLCYRFRPWHSWADPGTPSAFVRAVLVRDARRSATPWQLPDPDRRVSRAADRSGPNLVRSRRAWSRSRFSPWPTCGGSLSTSRSRISSCRRPRPGPTSTWARPETEIGVPAQVIRAGCVRLQGGPHRFGVRLIRARITGELDLSAMTFDAPLDFVGCRFDEAIHADGASLHSLSVRGKVHLRDDWMPGPLTSTLPGLIANGLHVRRNIDLSGTLVSGVHRSTASVAMTSAIWRTEARLAADCSVSAPRSTPRPPARFRPTECSSPATSE